METKKSNIRKSKNQRKCMVLWPRVVSLANPPMKIFLQKKGKVRIEEWKWRRTTKNRERSKPGTGAVARVGVVRFSGSHCCRSRSAGCGELWSENRENRANTKTERALTRFSVDTLCELSLCLGRASVSFKHLVRNFFCHSRAFRLHRYEY